MTTEEQKSEPTQVLEKIHWGTLSMKPKWYFFLSALVNVLGATIVLFALIYLASFILFALRATGVLFIPLFGFRGIFAFIFALPWLLFLTTLLFVLVLEILIRRYAFAYRRPLIYSSLGIMALVLIAGTAVERTHMHQRMFMASRASPMPFAGRMYRAFGEQRFRNIHRGTVSTLIPQGFTLQNRREELLTILVNQATRMSPQIILAPQDMVVVFGERDNNNTVQAIGIRKIKE